MKSKLIALLSLLALGTGCFEVASTVTSSSSDSGDTAENCIGSSFGSGVPDWIANNFDCVQVTVSGSYYKFVTNDVPEHQSAYFESDHELYTSTMPSNRAVNPNKISEQSYTFYIPISPSSGVNSATSGDAIGVAVDGVVFFNNEAAGTDNLSAEIATLDTANAHPTDGGAYHYHIEPLEITDNDAKIIGVLRDGYAVFGQLCPETNAAPTPSTGIAPSTDPNTLDENNGHVADTGITGLGTIYHYHLADIESNGVSISDPVVTDTYYGTPGSMVHN